MLSGDGVDTGRLQGTLHTLLLVLLGREAALQRQAGLGGGDGGGRGLEVVQRILYQAGLRGGRRAPVGVWMVVVVVTDTARGDRVWAHKRVRQEMGCRVKQKEGERWRSYRMRQIEIESR